MTNKALKSIAERATKQGTGARGLRRIIETTLNETMYEYFGTNVRYVVIDEAVALGQKSVPVFCLGEEEKVVQLLGDDEWIRPIRKSNHRHVHRIKHDVFE